MPTPKRLGGSSGIVVSSILVLVVAAVVALTTLYDLDGTPPGLYIDEVAIALTARALWETGADLEGTFLPLYPRSFRDREQPIPVNPVFLYTAIPFAIGGPGARASRLPAVLWCWVAAAGIGLCVHELTRSRAIGFAVGAGAALTPWLFVLGRMGWEAISFPAITSLAVWSLLRGARTRSTAAFVLSGALFGLSLYAYSTARLLVPLTIIAVGSIWLSDARSRIPVAWTIILAVLMALPLAYYMGQHPGALTWRMSVSSIWSDSPAPAALVKRFATNFLGYFSPRFLFLEGDTNLRHGTGRGMLPWIAAPLIIAGLWEAWRRRGERPVQLIVACLLIAPAAAALTTDGQPHAIRSITTVIFWAALAGIGLQRLLAILPGRRIVACALALLAVINAGVFAADYFGAWRDRAFGSFDGGKGVVLKEAFARRAGRPLYVPAALLHHVRMEVFIPYWGHLPVKRWLDAGPDSFGIHAERGELPREAIVVRGWYLDAPDGTLPGAPRAAEPPSGFHSVFNVTHGRMRTYDLFER